MKNSFCLVVYTLFAPFILWTSLFGWGTPHKTITNEALNVLPAWQKETLGKELSKLGDSYCLIPDHVYFGGKNAKFAKMTTRPGEVYILNLHLPAQQEENLETLHYFMEKAVQALLEKKVDDAARYMGTICHLIEDYGSPSHTIPGDNMFTLLQQFLPPTEAMKGKLLHSPVESGDFKFNIQGYQPTLLGITLHEASWRLMHRIHEGILNARTTTIPIIRALYAEDQESVEKFQIKAARKDAEIVSDAIYTIMSLGQEKFDDNGKTLLNEVMIGEYYPLEAESLYYPQSQFHSKPHWGCPQSGYILADGNKVMPLKLNLQNSEGIKTKEFQNGISAGMGRTLTFILPKGVYSKFSVLAGLHPELGEKGCVEYSILGDDKVLTSFVIKGTEPSHLLECDISHVSKLGLKLTSKSQSPEKNYAIWAQPTLKKQ